MSALWACLLASGVAMAAPKTVAVLYFDYGGKQASLEPLRLGMAQMLTQTLSTELGGCKIVERERLVEILGAAAS